MGVVAAAATLILLNCIVAADDDYEGDGDNDDDDVHGGDDADDKDKYDDDPRLPVEQPELLPMALQSVNEFVYGGVISVGHEIGFAPNTVELISGLEMPNPPLPEDPKIVRLR